MKGKSSTYQSLGSPTTHPDYTIMPGLIEDRLVWKLSFRHDFGFSLIRYEYNGGLHPYIVTLIAVVL